MHRSMNWFWSFWGSIHNQIRLLQKLNASFNTCIQFSILMQHHLFKKKSSGDKPTKAIPKVLVYSEPAPKTPPRLLNRSSDTLFIELNSWLVTCNGFMIIRMNLICAHLHASIMPQNHTTQNFAVNINISVGWSNEYLNHKLQIQTCL